MAGSRATTIDQTIQTEKARSSAGIEIQRLRRAIAPARRRPRRPGPRGASPRARAASRSGRGRGSPPSPAAPEAGRAPRPRAFRSIARIERCIQESAIADEHEEKREARGVDAREVEQRAEGDRQDEAAEAADHADEAADRADVVGIVDRDVLEDRRLAEAHEEAEREEDDDEGPETHARSRRRSAPSLPWIT